MSTQPRRSGGGSSARNPAKPSALSTRARSSRATPCADARLPRAASRRTRRGPRRAARAAPAAASPDSAGCHRARPRRPGRDTRERRVPRRGREQFRGACLPFGRMRAHRPDAGRSRRGPRGCRRTADPCPCASAPRRTSSSSTCLWTSAKLPAWYWWRYFMEPRGRAQRVYTLSRKEQIMRMAMRRSFEAILLSRVAFAPLAACCGETSPTPDRHRAAHPHSRPSEACRRARRRAGRDRGFVPREVRARRGCRCRARFKVAESAVVLSARRAGDLERRLARLPAARPDVHADARSRLSHRRDHERRADGVPHGLPRLRGDLRDGAVADPVDPATRAHPIADPAAAERASASRAWPDRGERVAQAIGCRHLRVDEPAEARARELGEVGTKSRRPLPARAVSSPRVRRARPTASPRRAARRVAHDAHVEQIREHADVRVPTGSTTCTTSSMKSR